MTGFTEGANWAFVRPPVSAHYRFARGTFDRARSYGEL